MPNEIYLAVPTKKSLCSKFCDAFSWKSALQTLAGYLVILKYVLTCTIF